MQRRSPTGSPVSNELAQQQEREVDGGHEHGIQQSAYKQADIQQDAQERDAQQPVSVSGPSYESRKEVVPLPLASFVTPQRNFSIDGLRAVDRLLLSQDYSTSALTGASSTPGLSCINSIPRFYGHTDRGHDTSPRAALFSHESIDTGYGTSSRAALFSQEAVLFGCGQLPSEQTVDTVRGNVVDVSEVGVAQVSHVVHVAQESTSAGKYRHLFVDPAMPISNFTTTHGKPLLWKLAVTLPDREFIDLINNLEYVEVKKSSAKKGKSRKTPSRKEIAEQEAKVELIDKIKQESLGCLMDLYYLVTSRDTKNVDFYAPNIALTVIEEGISAVGIKGKNHLTKAVNDYKRIEDLLEEIGNLRGMKDIADSTKIDMDRIFNYFVAQLSTLRVSFRAYHSARSESGNIVIDDDSAKYFENIVCKEFDYYDCTNIVSTISTPRRACQVVMKPTPEKTPDRVTREDEDVGQYLKHAYLVATGKRRAIEEQTGEDLTPEAATVDARRAARLGPRDLCAPRSLLFCDGVTRQGGAYCFVDDSDDEAAAGVSGFTAAESLRSCTPEPKKQLVPQQDCLFAVPAVMGNPTVKDDTSDTDSDGYFSRKWLSKKPN